MDHLSACQILYLIIQELDNRYAKERAEEIVRELHEYKGIKDGRLSDYDIYKLNQLES